jgi:hypothetical protein
MTHADYLRCWQIYLRKVESDKVFSDNLLDELRKIHPQVRVREWPKVWPSVQSLFDTTENFVKCVEAALAK